MSSPRNIRITQETNKLKQLNGLRVVKWSGLEMAARERTSEPPVWYSHEAPMLQFVYLNIEFSNHSALSLATYQNDNEWGLLLTDGIQRSDLETSETNCIYRNRVIKELPCGKISGLEVAHSETGDICKLTFNIEDQPISFRSGEIYENNDGSLNVMYMDESILIQVDGKMPVSS